MPWKTTDDGAIATTDVDGAKHPIWVKDDGSEEPFDPDRPLGKIAQLGRENAERRKAAEKLSKELEGWRALNSDPDTVKQLLDGGAPEDPGNTKDAEHRIREQVAATYKKQLDASAAELNAMREELTATRERMASTAIGGKFASSAWFSGEKPKSILPPDVAQAYFGRHFKLEEDGTIAGYLDPGKYEQRILIERGKNVGDEANFDEAIEALLERRQDKDRLLAGKGISGSGAPSNGHPKGGQNQDVSNLPASKRLELAFAAEGR